MGRVFKGKSAIFFFGMVINYKIETIIIVNHRESHAWQQGIPPRRYTVSRSLQITSSEAQLY